MWSPKTNANGARNPFYAFIKEVAPGDIVFSFCDTRIKALLGVVTGPAHPAGPHSPLMMASVACGSIDRNSTWMDKRLEAVLDPDDH